jgi:hypothetical protein
MDMQSIPTQRNWPNSENSSKAATPEGMEDEFGLLMDGTDREPNSGTKTLEFVKKSDIPMDKPPTYCRIVAAFRPKKEKKYRVQITVGGDRVIYKGEVSTKTADLATVKVHLNSVISTKDARYMTLAST